MSTNEYFYIDNDGIRWSQTGDIGYMDEYGNLFVEGRMSDYTMVDSKKIYNFDIEKVLNSQVEIKTCDVIANKNGDMVAHIIFDDEVLEKINFNDLSNGILEKYQRLIFEQCGDIDMVPKFFKIRKEFPYAKSGKRDILKMKEETDDMIYVSKDHLLVQQKVLSLKK